MKSNKQFYGYFAPFFVIALFATLMNEALPYLLGGLGIAALILLIVVAPWKE